MVTPTEDENRTPNAVSPAEAPPPARPVRDKRRRVFLAILLVVFPLLLLEGGARLILLVTDRRMDQIRFDPESFHYRIYREHPYTVYTLAPGSKRSENGIEYAVNSLGQRGPEIPLEKPSGETRIVCVGGSTTFGVLLEESLSYPRRLESILKNRFPDRPSTVVNAGIPGFTTAETLVNVALRVLDLSPDYLVILENVNEMNPRRWPGFAADYSHYRRPWTKPQPTLLGSLLESVSAFYCLARFHLTEYRWSQYVEFYCTVDFARNFTEPPVDLSETTLRPFRDRLVRLVRLARVFGARAVLCTMAHRTDPETTDPVFLELMAQQNAAIREVARAEGALLADLDAELTGRSEIFIDAVHTDSVGAAAMARIVAKSIAEDGTWGERRPRKSDAGDPPSSGGSEPGPARER